jgi:hypothetical protein
VGHTIGLQLARLVESLGPRVARAEDPLRAIAAALYGRRPALPDRPLARVEDVRRATQALAQLAAQIFLVHELAAADPTVIGQRVTLGDIGRTVILRAAIGQPPSATPLSTDEVVTFVRGHQSAADVEQALRKAARNLTIPSEFPTVIRGWMVDLEERLGKLAPDQRIDARILDGLLLQ